MAFNYRQLQRVLRFLVSGGLAAVAEYSTFIMLSVMFLFPVVLANTLSFCLGFIISFTLNKHWVFQSDGNMKRQMISYLILAVVNLCLGNVVIWILVEVSLPPLIAKIITMIFIASWNYGFFSRYIFKSTSVKNS